MYLKIGVRFVGEAFGTFYGRFELDLALEFCREHPDIQFQYHCSYGVHGIGNINRAPHKLKFTPCDTSLFPSTCFQQKEYLFKTVFSGVRNPCITQSNEHHTIACIWAHAYNSGRSVFNFPSFCEQYTPLGRPEPYISYHAACVDGVLSIPANEVDELNEWNTDSICEKLSDLPLSEAVCRTRLQHAKNILHKNDFYYNSILLGYGSDDEELLAPAAWNEEWNIKQENIKYR